MPCYNRMIEPHFRQTWQLTVTTQVSEEVVSYLYRHTGISRRKLKDAMNKGAVWLRRGHSKFRRIRRATTLVQSGDEISVYYDPGLLSLVPPTARLLWQCREYSLWYKPAGLLSQGTEYGDHASLLRQAELATTFRNPAYLIHRLDREAHGLMLIAHSSTAARRLSNLFQRRQVSKSYEVRVLGKPPLDQADMRQPLDGKPAVSHYELLQYDADSDTCVLCVRIQTGRRHQIRRHLAMLGHPVMGDPQYGQGNKNTNGLQLRATRLQFVCPFSGEKRDFELDALWRD